MATTDTLCFGDHDPVTGPPQIDGLVDYDYLPFDPVDQFERGYVTGSRLTFAGGGLARVIFQGVRVPATDRIVMGFLCRFDDHFDDNDFITIALRSSFASGAERLVAIYPNIEGVGAEPGVGNGPNQIKRNVPPPANRIDFWSRNGGASWTPIADPAGVEVKLRSWLPSRPGGAPNEVAWSVEVSWPRVGADGFTLNDNFGLYFNVVRVLQSDTVVQSGFPTTAPDLAEEPGPTFVVPAYGHGLIPAIQVPPGNNLGVGVRFQNNELGVGRRAAGSGSTVLTGTIEGPAGPSDNELVAFVENTGNADANDIWAEFRFANWGLPHPLFPEWDLAQGANPNPAPRRVGVQPPPFDPPANLLAGSPATPTSTPLVSSWPRASVPTQYQVHPHQCIWVQLNSATGVNFTQSSIRRNMDFDHLSELNRDAEVSGSGYPPPADGSSEHDFVIQTFCRRIVVAEIVQAQVMDNDTQALLAGAIAGQLPRDDNLTLGGRARGSTIKETVVFVWMAQGYRRTGAFIRIRGKVYENLDHTPGEFGVIASHIGLADPFSFALKAPGMVQYAPGLYGLKVPDKGTTTINVTLAARPGGPEGDRSELPKAPWPVAPGGDIPGSGGLPKGCVGAAALVLGTLALLRLLRKLV
ncbi:MAG: hypothetical protein ABIT04_09830 [Novosphingobium sp.]